MSADIVEVAPAYDTNAELTTMAAADVRFLPHNLMASIVLASPSLPFPSLLHDVQTH